MYNPDENKKLSFKSLEGKILLGIFILAGLSYFILPEDIRVYPLIGITVPCIVMLIIYLPCKILGQAGGTFFIWIIHKMFSFV